MNIKTCLTSIFFGAFAFSAISINLVVNGGFEYGTTYNWYQWGPASSNFAISVTTSSNNIHSGNYAGIISSFDGTNRVRIIYPGCDISTLSPGTLVKALVWIKTENIQLGGEDNSFNITLAIRDNSQNVIMYHGRNAVFSGTWNYTPIEIFCELIPNSAFFDIQLHFPSTMTSGVVYVDDVSVEVISDPGTLQTNLPICKIERDANDVPRLTINGEVKPPVFFFGLPNYYVLYEQISKAKSANVNFIQTLFKLPWQGTSGGKMEQILKINPNAMVLPRINLELPNYWINTHSNDIQHDELGNLIYSKYGMPQFSIASDAFFSECKTQIWMLVRYFHNSPYKNHIMGYHIGYYSGGEWFTYYLNSRYVDFSEVNRQKFAKWAETKYNNINNLNNAWKENYASFAEIQIPPVSEWETGDDGIFRDPSNRCSTIDYFTYYNNAVAERIAELASWIKYLNSDKSLFACFYGYQNELVLNGQQHGICHSGHLGMHKLLAADDVDIICSPFSYFDRGVAKPCNFHSVVDAITLAGKICLQEDDSFTWLTDPTNSMPNTTWWYPTKWDTMQCLRRNFGHVMIHNQGIWWMDLLGNGCFNADSIWNNNSSIISTYNDNISMNAQFQPEIALIYDEGSFLRLKSDCYNVTYHNNYAQRSIFQELGTSVGYYYIDNLTNVPDSVKLFVFVNSFYINNNNDTIINSIKGNGNTLLWLYAPGYVTDNALSLSRMSTLTGFPLARNVGPVNSEIIFTGNNNSIICDELVGRSFANIPNISPVFYGSSPESDYITLGRYNFNNAPGLMLKEYTNWNSIFCGAPKLSLPLLKSIARYAGVTLLVDSQKLSSSDVAGYNENYMYIYTKKDTGIRHFQLPGEMVPNGNFEYYTGTMPSSGFYKWISPFYGTLTTTVTSISDNNVCETGPFVSDTDDYNAIVGIRLPAKNTQTYKVSCRVLVDSIDASQAGLNDYIYINIQPRTYTSATKAFKIAEGKNVYVSDKTWTTFETTYTHENTFGTEPDEFNIKLHAYGKYSVSNIILDSFSVSKYISNQNNIVSPFAINVVDVINNVQIASGVISWNESLSTNEQKVYYITPLPEPIIAIMIIIILLLGKINNSNKY